MAKAGKQEFHAVEANVEEMEWKIRQHRKKIVMRSAAAVAFVAILAAAAVLYFAYKEYRGFEVLSEFERVDNVSTKYENFAGNILRYNNDGAYYADLSDQPIWNQAFEMLSPTVHICENYATVADLRGNQIYIMDTGGVQGEIKTNRPIEAACVANQGSVAVLTREKGVSYLEVYNKSGESLASGEIHVANSGFPLDIAFSNDAKKLAGSILDISKGKAKTTVAFYNFGSVGQNEIDNMISSYSYEDTVIPEIEFVSNDRMIAFGDNRVILFEGAQKPEEDVSLTLKEEVKSIFYDKDYFGLVYAKGGDASAGQVMKVYDMTGRLRLEQGFQMAYQKIRFLKNHEIFIQNEHECEIYTLRGVKKFKYTFDETLYQIFSTGSGSRYIFILDGAMEKVKLK